MYFMMWQATLNITVIVILIALLVEGGMREHSGLLEVVRGIYLRLNLCRPYWIILSGGTNHNE